MNILIQLQDKSIQDEIKEFLESNDDTVFSSHSSMDSISMLNNNSIDQAIISLRNNNDVVILKYLNDHYPGIKVTVIADFPYYKIISIFQQLKISIINEPVQLSQLKMPLTEALGLNEKI